MFDTSSGRAHCELDRVLYGGSRQSVMDSGGWGSCYTDGRGGHVERVLNGAERVGASGIDVSRPESESAASVQVIDFRRRVYSNSEKELIFESAEYRSQDRSEGGGMAERNGRLHIPECRSNGDPSRTWPHARGGGDNHGVIDGGSGH